MALEAKAIGSDYTDFVWWLEVAKDPFVSLCFYDAVRKNMLIHTLIIPETARSGAALSFQSAQHQPYCTAERAEIPQGFFAELS